MPAMTARTRLAMVAPLEEVSPGSPGPATCTAKATSTANPADIAAQSAGPNNPWTCGTPTRFGALDRKSTRLNSSHVAISYAVFRLKKKIDGDGHVMRM